jgi:hypothetical protein
VWETLLPAELKARRALYSAAALDYIDLLCKSLEQSG